MANTWGRLTGLQGLYEAPNKREAAREELATLKILSDEIKQKKVEEEANQLKVQEYQNQVSAFAASLLGPDRDRINEKARMLGNQVKDLIKGYGGDTSKFLENGGHQIMADYRNNLINSPEASIYLENKKNLELITQVQLSGKGALLTRRDIESMMDYQKNGEGKITYSGMMSEIEMPNPNAYEYGQVIPAEDILKHGNNALAIYGNYKLNYPDSPEPTHQDLISFVNANYREVGQSFAKQQMEMQKRQMEMKEAEFALDVQNKQLQGQKTMAEIAALQNKTSGSGTTKTGTTADGKRTEFVPNEVFQLFNETSGATAKNWEGYWKGNAKFEVLKSNMPKWTETGYNYNPREGGSIDFVGVNSFLDNTFSDQYAPRNAYQLFADYNPTIFVKHALGLDETQLDKANRSMLNVKPQNNWFWADGSNVKDKGVNLDYYTGNFEVKGIITAGTIMNQDSGTPSMIMDSYKKNGSIDTEETAKLNSAYKDSQISPQMMAVVENEEGVKFYVPLPNSSMYSQKLMNDPELASLQVAETMTDMDVKSARASFDKQYIENLGEQTSNFYTATEMMPDVVQANYSESRQFSPIGDPSFRSKLIKSFYAANLASMGLSGNDLMEAYKMSSNSGDFGIFVSQMKSIGYNDIQNDLKSGYTDMDIINKILNIAETTSNSDTAEMARMWALSYKDLITRKE